MDPGLRRCPPPIPVGWDARGCRPLERLIDHCPEGARDTLHGGTRSREGPPTWEAACALVVTLLQSHAEQSHTKRAVWRRGVLLGRSLGAPHSHLSHHRRGFPVLFGFGGSEGPGCLSTGPSTERPRKRSHKSARAPPPANSCSKTPMSSRFPSSGIRDTGRWGSLASMERSEE